MSTDFATASVQGPPTEEPVKSGPNKKLVIGGAVVAALVLAGGAFVLLSGGKDAPEAPVTPGVRKAAAPAQASPQKATGAAPAAQAPAQYDATLGRDPFAPLYPVAAKPDTAAVPAAGAAAPAAAAEPAVTPIQVKVSNVKADSAVVYIDKQKYTATVGEIFAEKWRLYAVFNGSCVGLSYGEKSGPVCVGETVSVTP